LELDLASGWLFVMHTFSYYFQLSETACMFKVRAHQSEAHTLYHEYAVNNFYYHSNLLVVLF